MTVVNPFTPKGAARALLPAPIAAACEAVDGLAARLEDARARAGQYAQKAERPDHWHMEAVRAAVAAGGSSQDVPDERAAWVEGYRQAQEDKQALGPLLDVAWRDLREAMLAHRTEALPAVEATVTDAAADYAAALDAATAAEARHREAMTLRRWLATAQQKAGPDPFKPEREKELTVGKLTALPSQALALLRADAAALDTLHEQERQARARADREARIAAERKAASAALARREREAAQRHAELRAAKLETERARTAAREAARIPGMPEPAA